MSSSYRGSCLCGKVRFDVNGDFESFFLCHCEYCQKDTGSAHAANLFSSSARLNWVCGEDNVRTFHVPSTRHSKSFCATCGSALPKLQMNGALLVVPAGSLDCDVTIRPTAHIFVASKANWDDGLEHVPLIEKLPT
jgi:hypothetical protein